MSTASPAQEAAAGTGRGRRRAGNHAAGWRCRSARRAAGTAVSGGDDRASGHLSSVHRPARVRGKRIPAVHDTAVVPDDQVAHPPLMGPHVLPLGGMDPQRVEKFLAVLRVQADHVLLGTARQIENCPVRVGMPAHQRMPRVRRLRPHPRHLYRALRGAGAVVRAVLMCPFAFARRPQAPGQVTQTSSA